MNLLPWRLTAHRQRSRQAFRRFILVLGTSLAAYIALWQVNLRSESELNRIQAELEQMNQKLPALIAQVRRQQQHLIQQANSKPVARAQIQQTMDLLQQLPFIQGELSDFTLDAEQIRLKGKAQDQREFEQIQQFLNEFPALKSELQQFLPQQNELQFEFYLSRENTS